jgi:hypothetical protein
MQAVVAATVESGLTRGRVVQAIVEACRTLHSDSML